MSKIEECWVIQRDDGMFFNGFDDFDNEEFCDNPLISLFNLSIFLIYKIPTKEMCEEIIKMFFNLKDCKPVKVEIRVVGE